MHNYDRVFKVVRREGTDLVSATTFNIHQVRYTPDQFVFGDYPLFAFNTLIDALRWIFPLEPPYEVWVADAQGKVETPPIMAGSQYDIVEFWNVVRGHHPVDRPMLAKWTHVIPGTVLYHGIRLVHKAIETLEERE